MPKALLDPGDSRAAKRAWDSRRTIAANNLHAIPEVIDPNRRAAAEVSLQKFLESYFPAVFRMGWSEDHLKVIQKTEQALRDGTYFALAMPRGSGKSSIHQRAAIWALVYGHCHFVMVVCADASKARGALGSIKTELDRNMLLSHDFPEVCYPIRKIDNQPMKAKGQHLNGKPTDITWTAEEVVLPTIPGSASSGGILRVSGITSASRGAQYTREDKSGHVTEVIRPELILIDDFQTRESAASPTQSRTRLQIMAGDLGGMAGPGEKLSMLATMTVVYEGDAADQLLNRSTNSEWHGERFKLVYEWPKAEDLWETYVDMRRAEERADTDHSESTQFYADHREQMDEGAVVGWPERYRKGELSAIQHAYNLKYPNEEAFASEYQNEPVSQQIEDLNFLSTADLAAKLNNLDYGAVRGDIEKITCGIDVQGSSLWWVITAWGSDYSGQILDYGVWPEQPRRSYTLRELPRTFLTQYPGLNEEEAIYAGLTDLGEKLSRRRWMRDDGAELALCRGFIDEGYKDKVVHLFCRQSLQRQLWFPCKGYGIGAGRPPMSEWLPKKREKVGMNWRIRLGVDDRTIQHCLIDVNWWKTFIQERWAVPMGGRGCLTLWGKSETYHRLFAEHLTNEVYVVTEGHGRRVVEWQQPTNRPDQHWADAMVYATVAANEQGISLMGEKEKPQRKSTRYLSVAEKRRRNAG